MYSDFNIEIIITKTDGSFKASCPTFPHCKGIGDTKEIALDHLSENISTYIAKTSKTYLRSLFKSSDYSEVILDPKEKETFEHRIFDPEAAKKTFKKNVLIKLKSIQYADLPVDNSAQDLEVAITEMFQKELSEEERQTETGFTTLLNDPVVQKKLDGFLFGIPLCLN